MSTRLLALVLLLPPQTDPVADLVDRLRSERPAEREQACQRIRELGRDAVPHLNRAAADASPELASRSRQLLKALELRESLPPALLREFPDLELRLALGSPEWTRALLEAAGSGKDGGSLHPALLRKDLEALAAEAVRGIRNGRERNHVYTIIVRNRLRGALPALHEKLRDPDSGVRRETLNVVAELGAPESLRDIDALVDDPDLCDHAVTKLAEMQLAAALPLLRQHLHSKEAEVRMAAVSALATLTCAEVVPALRDPDPGVRRRAIQCFGRTRDRERIPDLAALLNDPDPGVRISVRESLQQLAAVEALPSVRPLLKSPDPDLRLHAIYTLIGIRGRDAAADLLPLLEDDIAEVRWEAATAVCALRIREGIPALCRQLTDPDSGVRFSAARALAELRWMGITPHFTAQLKDPDVGTRCFALCVLSDYRLGPAIPQIAALLQDPEESVREAAAEALGKLRASDQAVNLVPLLVRNSHVDSDASVAALIRLKARDCIPGLLALATHPDDLPRHRALTVLGQTKAPEALPVFRQLLGHPCTETRRLALEGLSAGMGKEAAPLLRPLLLDPDLQVRFSAAGELVDLQDTEAAAAITTLLQDHPHQEPVLRFLERLKAPASAPAVTALLANPEFCYAEQGLKTLAAINGPREFIQALKHPQGRVRAEAAAAIGDRELAEAIPDLLPLLEDPYAISRETAREALVQIGTREVLPHLLQLLHDDDPNVRCRVLSELRRLRAPASAEAILARLRDPEASVVRYAIHAAGELVLTEAIPQLSVLMDGDDLSLREPAACALLRLGCRSGIPRALEARAGNPFELNRIRRPALWEKLRTTPQSRPYRGNLEQLWAQISKDSGIVVDLDSLYYRGDPDLDVPISTRNGQSTFLDALLQSCRGLTFILEDDRIRILSVEQAAAYWKVWWQSEGRQ